MKTVEEKHCHLRMVLEVIICVPGVGGGTQNTRRPWWIHRISQQKKFSRIIWPNYNSGFVGCFCKCLKDVTLTTKWVISLIGHANVKLRATKSLWTMDKEQMKQWEWNEQISHTELRHTKERRKESEALTVQKYKCNTINAEPKMRIQWKDILTLNSV